MPPERSAEDMQVRNLSPHTIDCYVRQVALFARYFNRSPELLGLDEIRAYQLHLVRERELGWGSFNQAVCALRLLYLKTLGRDWHIESIPFAKQPKTLPLVLSQGAVRAVLEAISNPQNRVIAMTLYAAGLRVSEAVSLRIADIDSQRMLARVVVDRTWEQATRTEGELERYLPDTARGGHAVCLVGYTADGFIVRNSWGPGWGAGGFAYASDDYAADAIHEAYGAVL